MPGAMQFTRMRASAKVVASMRVRWMKPAGGLIRRVLRGWIVV